MNYLTKKLFNVKLIQPNHILQFMLLLFFSIGIAHQASAYSPVDYNIRKSCAIDNPLKLPWLADKIDQATSRTLRTITQFQHQSITYFALNDGAFGCMATIYDAAVDPKPVETEFFNCEGELICKDDCADDFKKDYRSKGKIIWTYCDYACNYETTGIVKFNDAEGCGFYIESNPFIKFFVQDIYNEFSFEVGQKVEFSYSNSGRYFDTNCENYTNIEINCIRAIEPAFTCQVPASKITSNPVICGRGVVNLETDFESPNRNFIYVFVKVSKADDSFEVLTNTAVADDSACYYGIAYDNNCDVPNFTATTFSEILNAEATYTITDCFEIERAEAPGYLITTKPYCINEDLFTVGITITGASGKYIIGEDYTGNIVVGVAGENFITLKTGQEYYYFRPTDAITGCGNDFGIAVQDPECSDCLCTTLVDPVCGADGETYSNACLAACANVEVAYHGECNALPKIFVDYPWLNDLINVNSCETGTQVDLYKAGNFYFIHIQYITGIDRMYFENGTIICETGDRATCLKFFNFGEPLDSWQCKGITLADPFFFDNYAWLNPIIDVDNCEGLTIKQYEKRSHKYILVESSTMCNLYYQNGFLFCSDEEASVCLKQFNLAYPTKVWTCKDGGNKTLIPTNEELFNIVPNPNKGTFNVTLSNSHSDTQNLHLLDLNGKVIQSYKVAPNQQKTTVNLPNISKGVYWLQLRSINHSSSQKIIIH